MNILTQAIKKYRSQLHTEALELFEKAAEIYDPDLVQGTILLCKKALGLAPDSNISAVNPIIAASRPAAIVPKPNLDPATRYMLARMGKLNLSKVELKKCLEEHKKLTSRKSENAEVKPVNPIPADWPKDLILALLPESTNDFRWHIARKSPESKKSIEPLVGLSVIIPTFNRSKILDVTLACLVNQETKYPFEVIVADDGSRESIDFVVRQYEPLLDIKYVRQKDYGYQLCAIRNLGLRAAKHIYVAILDCDMAPNPKWVQSYMELLTQSDDIALIGPRKYVDTTKYAGKDFIKNKELVGSLPDIEASTDPGRTNNKGITLDWRLDHFKKTEDLRLCDSPFRYFSGGNVAFARKWLEIVGWFDEDFNHWGGEDNEFGYRLYRHGCFFRTVWGAMAYHQEPPGKENETDRAEGQKITINLVRNKVPYFYRKILPLATSQIHAKPLVSIYIPAHNCSDHIVRCVDSALNQTVVDLEVCICDDGSTDDTPELIKKHYGNNPRVRMISKPNGGIGSASNTALRMARGYYIGQLDSDDFLEPDAVELCLKEFLADNKLACVYTTNRNVNPDGSLISNGYNWPVYSREKLTTAMIAHHFRMFTARAWHLTEGFDETIENAVDYDMYLKLSEIGSFKHINMISYNRVLHGENTSIKRHGIQKNNHYLVVNNSIARQNAHKYLYVPSSDSDSSRSYKFQEKNKGLK
jgi:chondroitin synthase